MPAVLGPVSEVLNDIQNAIIASTTFINQCSLDSTTAAEQVVRHAYRPDLQGSVAVPDDLPMPIVLVRQENLQFDFQFPRGQNCALRSSVVRIQIFDRYRSTTHQDSVAEFDNFYGSLISDFIAADINTPRMNLSQVAPPQAVERRDGSSTFGFWVVEFDLQEGNRL